MRSQKTALALLILSACKGGEAVIPDDKGGDGDGDGSTTSAFACPQLTITRESVDFGLVPLGSTSSDQVVITNSCVGTESLDLWFNWSQEDAAAIAADFPASATLAPNEVLSFNVSFTAGDYDAHQGIIGIASSDPLLPGLDLTVLGQANPDQDGDGADALEAGGTDCDDTNASAFPQDAETSWDLVDDDCDGLVDEDFISVGDVLVSEIMMNPLAVGDGYGEWMELSSVADHDIDLIGWRLTSDDGDDTTIQDHLIIEAGGMVVIGVSADTSLNGGVAVDQVYDRNEFSLADAADSIFLYVGSMAVFDLTYSSSWPLGEGVSTSLDPLYIDPSLAGNRLYWCVATTDIGGGDLGTPGAANDQCSSIDHDGDLYTVDEGDCDDNDATLSPGATETWDGIDNNCDGLIDTIGPSEALGWVEGSTAYTGPMYLGWHDSLSVVDFDGDGAVDVLAGSSLGGTGTTSYYTGAVMLFDGGLLGSMAGAATSYMGASWTGSSYYNYAANVGRSQGDVDGDGTVDLFVGGSDSYSYYGNNAAGALYSGAAGVTGTFDPGDALVTFSDSDGFQGTRNVSSSADLDGDGFAEVIYGEYGGASYNASERGYVYVFGGDGLADGGDLSITGDYDLRWSGSSSGDELGSSISVGDINNDGYNDVLVGAPGASINNNSESGALYDIEGGSKIWDTGGTISDSYEFRIRGDAAGDRLGEHTNQIVGDVRNNGYPDLVISAPTANMAYVTYNVRSQSGNYAASDADLTIAGTGAEKFGWDMTVGDFDGDTILDLAISAPGGTDPLYDKGTAYGEVSIFSGPIKVKGTRYDTDADFWITSDAKDLMGLTMAAGDADGDGKDELFVAAPAYKSTQGRVLFFGF